MFLFIWFGLNTTFSFPGSLEEVMEDNLSSNQHQRTSKTQGEARTRGGVRVFTLFVKLQLSDNDNFENMDRIVIKRPGAGSMRELREEENKNTRFLCA